MYPPRGVACDFHAAGGSLFFFSSSSWNSPRLEEVASMNVASCLDDLERWRQRAEESRAIAKQMNDKTAKELMLRTAGIYAGLPSERRYASSTRRREADAPITAMAASVSGT